jgi:hypothetical protein
MSTSADQKPCPSCGEPVATSGEGEQQLALASTECPNCGAALERVVDGHADLGWRLREEGAAPG